MQLSVKDIVFSAKSEYVTLSEIESDENKISVKIEVDFAEEREAEPVTVRWECASDGVFSQWNSMLWSEKALNPNWSPTVCFSSVSRIMPIQSHIDNEGLNRITVYVTDNITPITITSGIIEETTRLQYKLILFSKKTGKMKKYETELVIDRRKIPLYALIPEISQTLCKKIGVNNSASLSCLREPVYSTWYSYHQSLESKKILNELTLAKEYGMKTVIIDDGWQTRDTGRGYGCCGDWQPEGLPDLRELSDTVHKMGMKIMLWFSVPYVSEKSKCYKRFKGKFLASCGNNVRWYVLDPRYKEVRKYLVSVYENAVKAYKLDGLKLDFIDSFEFTEESVLFDEEMDFSSVEVAVKELLGEIFTSLRKLKPDIMIEFRQNYIGAVMMNYGNMLRVADCPCDPLKNRAGSIALRLTAGKIPVHSDMIAWSVTDTAESAALEIINVIFAVPQISVLIERLPEEHKKMLKFYMDFWLENRDCLMGGSFAAYNSECGFSLALSRLDDTLIAAAYTKNVLSLDECFKMVYFINGSWDKELIVVNHGAEYSAKVTVFDCMGNIQTDKVQNIGGCQMFAVSKSGMVLIKRINPEF